MGVGAAVVGSAFAPLTAKLPTGWAIALGIGGLAVVGVGLVYSRKQREADKKEQAESAQVADGESLITCGGIHCKGKNTLKKKDAIYAEGKGFYCTNCYPVMKGLGYFSQ